MMWASARLRLAVEVHYSVALWGWIDVWGSWTDFFRFRTSPPGQQLRVVTTNLGDGDERKKEGKG